MYLQFTIPATNKYKDIDGYANIYAVYIEITLNTERYAERYLKVYVYYK